MSGCCLPIASINIIPEMQLLLYKLKERTDSFSPYVKVQASNLCCTSKKKTKPTKQKASKHNRHSSKTHTINSYCLPELNKENA